MDDRERFRVLVLEVLDAIDTAGAADNVDLVVNASAVDALRRSMKGW